MATHQDCCSPSSVPFDGATRSAATRAGAERAVRATAFASVLALPERTGALIAKNAAETIKKVWMFLVFMRTPFLTACLS
jgi:hypothetical protein